MTPVQRIRAVLDAEAAAIARVNITDEFIEAVHWVDDCSGRIVTIGMGKAGIVARKFAATLCSVGMPSVFLHPGEAAHGDLGVLSPDDLVVAFSTSGKTAEVLEALDASAVIMQYRRARVIAITSHPDSPLRARSDLVIDMGVIEEPCPLGLTPTASTAVMLAISDALAMAAMEVKGITRQDFGARHRAGYLGALAGAECK